MKIYIEGSAHHKNEAGMGLLQSQGFDFHRSYDKNIKYDQVHIFNEIREARRSRLRSCLWTAFLSFRYESL